MKVNRNELLEVMAKVKPGLSKKEIIEQATHFIFAQKEVVTYNDQLCIMHPFDMDIEFSVKGEEFNKILNGIDETDVELILSDGNLDIKSKSTKAKLSTIIGEEAKVDHLIAAIKAEISGEDFWQPLPKEFIDGLYLCAFSANKDVATGVRSCVAVKDDSIFSTDNIRVSNYIMDSGMQELLIPAKDAMELVKYKVTEYGRSENWMHFRTPAGIVFNCKMLKGEYPYSMVSKVFADKDSMLEFPTELKAAVQTVTTLAEGDTEVNKTIRVSIDKTKIIVKAEKDRGWIEKTIPFQYSGDSCSFLINPIFFAQILSHATGFVLLDGKAQFASDNFYHAMALPSED